MVLSEEKDEGMNRVERRSTPGSRHFSSWVWGPEGSPALLDPGELGPSSRIRRDLGACARRLGRKLCLLGVTWPSFSAPAKMASVAVLDPGTARVCLHSIHAGTPEGEDRDRVCPMSSTNSIYACWEGLRLCITVIGLHETIAGILGSADVNP